MGRCRRRRRERKSLINLSALLGPQFKDFSVVDHEQCLSQVTESEHLDDVSSFVTTIKRVLSKMLEPYFIEVFVEDVCM